MNKKIILVVIGIIFLLGIIGAISNNQKNLEPRQIKTSEPLISDQNNADIELSERGFLEHKDLLKIIKENPNKVLEKSYEMGLYLEQQPTTIDADFMSQADVNSNDTILITCKMQSIELQKLDGASAQKGDYKLYNLNVKFTKYNNQFGFYYEAVCTLK